MREKKKGIKLVKSTAAPKNLKEITGPDKKEPNRTGEALKRLGVTAEQLAAAPDITSMLKRAEGGLKQVIAAMRFSGDELVTTFLKKYDSITEGDRERLSIEAIALAVGLNLSHLLGSIMMSLQQQSISLVKIIAVTNHPSITQARVSYGLMPLGERDRTALDTSMGFLPSPKGPTFIGKAVFGSGANAMDQQRRSRDSDDEDDDYDGPDLDRLFPPANRMQEKLQAIRQLTPEERINLRSKTLPPGTDERKPN
jgi:hypothetical protein